MHLLLVLLMETWEWRVLSVLYLSTYLLLCHHFRSVVPRINIKVVNWWTCLPIVQISSTRVINDSWRASSKCRVFRCLELLRASSHYIAVEALIVLLPFLSISRSHSWLMDLWTTVLWNTRRIAWVIVLLEIWFRKTWEWLSLFFGMSWVYWYSLLVKYLNTGSVQSRLICGKIDEVIMLIWDDSWTSGCCS